MKRILILVLSIEFISLIVNGETQVQMKMNNNITKNKIDLAKFPRDGGDKYNRLIFEKSPYLRQHAENPVDWFPWSEEAFAKAIAENKPIFLSIGYSSCHWCHVMEHESFEDEDVAKFLNANFVSIKVDREERPDIDNIYMTATQLMTGSGGWPMSVFLTHDKKPFFCGTYFPKLSSFGRPGFLEILRGIDKTWSENKGAIANNAEQLTKALIAHNTKESNATSLNADEILTLSLSNFKNSFDETHAGFNRAPKFHTPHNLMLLLRIWKRSGDTNALDMVEKTLTAMRLGGIFDQLGLGYHRYSTDQKWLVPHFEKMLYDQALIALANLETYQATGDSFFAQNVREVLQYVEEQMMHNYGGFFSAEDADSEGIEGKYYTWSANEIEKTLGKKDAEFFNKIFLVKPEGNFDPEHGESENLNILHLKNKITKSDADKLKPMQRKLISVRAKRIPPLKDDKILTDWNGLMISAYAQAGAILHDEKYIKIAKNAVAFIYKNLTDDKGRLLKRFHSGEAKGLGFLDDYAFMIKGLLDLHQASQDLQYLEKAISLTDNMLVRFWDKDNGGLFFNASDSEKLLVRTKESYDGAIPSGNSVASHNLARLYFLTGNNDYLQKSQSILQTFSADLKNYPNGYTYMLLTADLLSGNDFNQNDKRAKNYTAKQITIASTESTASRNEMFAKLQKQFMPDTVIIYKNANNSDLLAKLIPHTKNQTAIDDKSTAYVCSNFTCKKPTTSTKELIKLISDKE